MKRHPELQRLLDNFTEETSGISMSQAIESKICVSCRCEIGPDSFKDDISRREYDMSGLCPTCQNVVFAEPSRGV